MEWKEFFSRLNELEFEEFDLIVAIANGGIIPAGFIQQRLNIPMRIININYRDLSNNPRFKDAKLLEKKDFEFQDKKILLIDDVSRSGKTIEKAKEYLEGNQIKTCLVNGKGDYWFFQSKECLKLPWRK